MLIIYLICSRILTRWTLTCSRCYKNDDLLILCSHSTVILITTLSITRIYHIEIWFDRLSGHDPNVLKKMRFSHLLLQFFWRATASFLPKTTHFVLIWVSENMLLVLGTWEKWVAYKCFHLQWSFHLGWPKFDCDGFWIKFWICRSALISHQQWLLLNLWSIVSCSAHMPLSNLIFKFFYFLICYTLAVFLLHSAT